MCAAAGKPPADRTAAAHANTMIRQAIRLATSRRGQALLEFAFVVPLMLVFLFAIVDFGIAMDRRITLQHAVADGARRGAVNPDIAATISFTEDESQGLLDNTANPGAVVVCFTDDNANGRFGEVGDSIVVNASFDYDFTVAFDELLGAFGVSIPGTISMTPSATKRLETTASVNAADQCA